MARGLPFFGNLFGVMGGMRAYLTQQYLELGPVFRLRLLNRELTVLAGVEANLFANEEGGNYLRASSDMDRFIKAMGAQRATPVMEAPDHSRMREATNSSYTSSFAEDHVARVVEIVRAEIAGWPPDEPVPALRAFQHISTDLLGTLNLGVPSREYLDDLVDLVRTMLLVYVIRNRPPLILRTPRFKRTRVRIDEFVEEIIAAHAQGPSDRARDLVDDMVELNRQDPEFLPKQDLRAALLTPFFAGLDALSSICAVMSYILVRRPDLRERMTQEADRFFASGVPDIGMLRQADVTKRVAMEALRMYPPFPALVRVASQPFEFGGYRIGEGERIIVGTTVPHYLPECFPDPERFDIDRYSPERMEHRQPGAFAPWGVGHHGCQGRGFSEVVIAVTMLTVVHDLELSLHPADYELKKFKPTPVFTPDSSLRLLATRRRR